MNSATSHEVPQNGALFTPSTSDIASPSDKVRRLKFTPLPDPLKKEQAKIAKATEIKKDQWQGKVYGEVLPDRDALADILKRVMEVEERVLKENMAVLDEEDEISEEDEPLQPT